MVDGRRSSLRLPPRRRCAHYDRMSLRVLLPSIALALTLSSAGGAHAAPGDDTASMRVYRCVGSNGSVALQDGPCRSGTQEVREMQRPQDPPPRSVSTRTPEPSPPPPPAREVRVVTVQPPQPMYECVTAEGARYTSETSEGNPRWVPAWTQGYIATGPGIGPRPRPAGRPDHRPDNRYDNRPGPGRPPVAGRGVIVPYGNVQIRDACHALPQGEVCARLADRRWELIRRYNSALQSEREQLTREQRGIEARLDQDCGGA